MFRKGVTSEVRWLFVFLAVGLALGVLTDALCLMMFLSAMAFIIWSLTQLYGLETWISRTRQVGIHDQRFRGVWQEMAEDVELIIKRSDKEKQRLQGVVSRIQDMTSALTDGVVIVDKRGNIEWWNGSAERLFDFGPLDIGQKLSNYVRSPVFLKYFEHGDYEEPLPMTLPKYDEQSFEFHVHRFGDGDRLFIARDITRLTHLERMRKDFVANVSHELRTPLTVLTGYLETLADSSQLSPPWQRALDQMQEQARRMTALIKDLLMLARLETEDRENGQEPIRLLPLFEQIIADAKVVSGEKAHEFVLHCEAHIQIMGREPELRSAFTNLVNNAVHYTPSHSKVAVMVDLTPLELIVKIKDNGPGIASRHIPRLTERFYRVDDGRSRDQGGTGLGLAIVKHILIRHDAELRIRSKLGKGSTFSCHFPLRRFLASLETDC